MNNGLFLRPLEQEAGSFGYLMFDFKRVKVVRVDNVYNAVYIFCQRDHVKQFHRHLISVFGLSPVKFKVFGDEFSIVQVDSLTCFTNSNLTQLFSNHPAYVDILMECSCIIIKTNCVEQVANHFRKIQNTFPYIYIYVPKLLETKFFLCRIFNPVNDYVEDMVGTIKIRKIKCSTSLGGYLPTSMYFHTLHGDVVSTMTLNADISQTLKILKSFPVVSLRLAFRHLNPLYHCENSIYAISLGIYTTRLFFITFIVSESDFEYAGNENVLVFSFRNEKMLLKAFHQFYIMGELFKLFKHPLHFMIGDDLSKNIVGLVERYFFHDLGAEVEPFIIVENGSCRLSQHSIIHDTATGHVPKFLTYRDHYIESMSLKDVETNNGNGTQFVHFNMHYVKNKYVDNYVGMQTKKWIEIENPQGTIDKINSWNEIGAFINNNVIEKMFAECTQKGVSIFSLNAPNSLVWENSLLTQFHKRGVFLMPSIDIRSVMLDGTCKEIYEPKINFNFPKRNVYIESGYRIDVVDIDATVVNTFMCSLNNMGVLAETDMCQFKEYESNFVQFKYNDLLILIFKHGIALNEMSSVEYKQIFKLLSDRRFVFHTPIAASIYNTVKNQLIKFIANFSNRKIEENVKRLYTIDNSKEINAKYVGDDWFVTNKNLKIDDVQVFFHQCGHALKLASTHIQRVYILDGELYQEFDDTSLNQCKNVPSVVGKRDFKMLILYYDSKRSMMQRTFNFDVKDFSEMEMINFVLSFRDSSHFFRLDYPDYANTNQKSVLRKLYARVK